MYIKSGHRFIAYQPVSPLSSNTTGFVEEELGNQKKITVEIFTLEDSHLRSEENMTKDKIKTFYITVSVTLIVFLLILIFYGYLSYRRRKFESLEKRNSMDSMRRRRNGSNEANNRKNSEETRHLQQKLLNK